MPLRRSEQWFQNDEGVLQSDLLILLQDITTFLQTPEPGTTLGITLQASLKKVLREKVQKMSERIINLEKL